MAQLVGIVFGPFTLQPSEFAKIAIVLFVAYIMVKLQKTGKQLQER